MCFVHILQMTATTDMNVSVATAVRAQGLGRGTTTLSPPTHGTGTIGDDRSLALHLVRGTPAAVAEE